MACGAWLRTNGDAGHDRDLRDAALSVDSGSDLHHRWVYPARHLRRLDLRPEPELSVRALPDRSAGDCVRLCLSSGGDLGRLDSAGADLYGRTDESGLRHADDDQYDTLPDCR